MREECLTGQIESNKDRGSTTHSILNELQSMDGETGFRGNNKNPTLSKSFYGQKTMESYDRLRPDWIRHIKKNLFYHNFPIRCYISGYLWKDI